MVVREEAGRRGPASYRHEAGPASSAQAQLAHATPCHAQRPCTPVRARDSMHGAALRHRRVIGARSQRRRLALHGPAASGPCQRSGVEAVQASVAPAPLFSHCRLPRHALPRRRSHAGTAPMPAAPARALRSTSEAWRRSGSRSERRLSPQLMPACGRSAAQRCAALSRPRRQPHTPATPTPLQAAASCRFRRIPRRTPQLLGGPATP